MAENINIAGRLHSTATGNVVAGANEIYDDTKGKKQSVVNQETEAAIQAEIERATEAENDRYTKSETYSKTELNNMITTPNQQYVTVATYASLPASGSADTIYRVSSYNGSTSQVDSTMYSEYAWNGSDYVFLCVKSQIDEVFDITVYNSNTKYADLSAALGVNGVNIPESLRKGGMSVKYVQSSGNKYVQYRLMADEWSNNTEDWAICSDEILVDNYEFIRVCTDKDNKILWAIKADGTIYFGAGVPPQVVDYINERISELSLDEYGNIVDFLNGLEEGDKTLQQLLNSKLDAEGLDSNALSTQSIIDNPEFIQVTTDSEDKILQSRNPEGVNKEYIGIETPKVSIDGATIENIQDPEGRTEIKTDSEKKILSYRDSEGVMHENVGIESANLSTNSLNLTADGMTEFQQALKDAGFQPGGSGDYTDKESMYIPEPRLAHLNILTDFDLTTLTKTSDVKCQVEFTDGAGNYFKKWIILNGQGRSSLNFVKKGLGIDFFNENPNDPNFDEDNIFKIKFGDWVAQDSFHCKSFYTDWPRCTTPVVYKLANEVSLTRGIEKDRPYKKYYINDYSDGAYANSQSDLSHNMETGARCVPDGFPIIVYQNGEFWGVNSLQLKKHRDNYLLNKKKDSNLHLDGDFGDYSGTFPDCFWDWNGTIDWNHFCSGPTGIEIRNPKNLYCIDGKKYDADTHDAEIIDTATAEEWIAAGQIIPTGKTIDDTLAGYLRTTGKVRKNIEDLTEYIAYINNLISGGASTADIKAAIEERFDVNNFIDYILIGNITGNTDAWDNNGQIVTWGKLNGESIFNWSINTYDCDVTFGCSSLGNIAEAANNYKLGINYPLFKPFWDYYYEDIKQRYAELRNKGIFDAEHITGLFRSWMDRVGYDNYSKEYKKWPDSPCFRDGSKEYTGFPTTGGFYGSIYRIYLWVKKRIEYMDAQDFFDYHN